jgi:hypothetical protein
MNSAEAWKKGIIAGFQSKKPGFTPPMPGYLPLAPVNAGDLEKYYYDLGYKEGVKMAK